jgi:hypothetical protein
MIAQKPPVIAPWTWFSKVFGGFVLVLTLTLEYVRIAGVFAGW